MIKEYEMHWDYLNPAREKKAESVEVPFNKLEHLVEVYDIFKQTVQSALIDNTHRAQLLGIGNPESIAFDYEFMLTTLKDKVVCAFEKNFAGLAHIGTGLCTVQIEMMTDPEGGNELISCHFIIRVWSMDDSDKPLLRKAHTKFCKETPIRTNIKVYHESLKNPVSLNVWASDNYDRVTQTYTMTNFERTDD
jgi:hypothetical protein